MHNRTLLSWFDFKKRHFASWVESTLWMQTDDIGTTNLKKFTLESYSQKKVPGYHRLVEAAINWICTFDMSPHGDILFVNRILVSQPYFLTCDCFIRFGPFLRGNKFNFLTVLKWFKDSDMHLVDSLILIVSIRWSSGSDVCLTPCCFLFSSFFDIWLV